MKPKKQSSKLHLNKTTISKLDGQAQKNVLGGAGKEAEITSIFHCGNTFTSCGLFACEPPIQLTIIRRPVAF